MYICFILDDYIINCKDKRGDCKTTDKRHEHAQAILYDRNTYTTTREEDIKVRSYGSNIFTTIRQEDIKVM